MTSLLYKYWGKAHPPDDGGPAYHLLPYHCLDVAAVANQWLQLDSALMQTFVRATQLSSEYLTPWLLFFVALHDLGKWDVRFQLKAKEIALQINPLFAEAQPEREYYHDKEGYIWFANELDTYGFPQDEDHLRKWMKAVGAHHGQVPYSTQLNEPRFADDVVINMDRDARLVWVQSLKTLFLTQELLEHDICDIPQDLLAGFCSVSDWLGSNSDYFKYETQPDLDMAEYFEQKQEIASQVLKDSGIVTCPSSQGGMKILFPQITPRGIQKKVQEWPIESGLTIIEAPTGSGKTEAALAYASHLIHAGLADSLIFALPTQATANAMLDRLEEMTPHLFPGGSSNLILAHGKSGYNSAFKNLKKAANGLTVQAKEEAYAQCSQWLGSSRKRVFLGQIGVCTIDQVLLSVLPIRHHFIREFGINRSILIVDEVHAYDSYMNGLLDLVLERQAKAKGTAILLSATLPSERRKKLMQIWNKNLEEPLTAAAYPLVSHVSESKTQSWEQDEPVETKNIFIQKAYGADMLPDEVLLKEICSKASQGAKIAIICNLVAHAQSIAKKLQAMTQVPVDIFHSRYRFIDRNSKEQAVIEQYGKKASEKGGRILVATQVIEQSLDLDFDWMITQLCPVDLLFQRWGRLHRHPKQRLPGFEKPLCTVLLPSSDSYLPHSFIYENIRVLWRTEQKLKQTTQVTFPEAYRDWIESVYQEEPWPNESEVMTEAFHKHTQEEFKNRSKARTLANSETKPWQDTEAKASILTRDGEMSLNVIPCIQQGQDSWSLTQSRNLNQLHDFEKDEILSLNTVPVPHSWIGYFPPSEEGVIYLPLLLSEIDTWQGETPKAFFRYNLDFGFEMEKKV